VAEEVEEVSRALFFPDASLVTPSVKQTGGFNQIGEYAYSTEYLRDHPTDGPFNELMQILKTAKKSLDLCIYVLSFPPLCDLLMDLYDKHSVSIRIIIDSRENEALRSQIPRLSRRGIDIRCNEKSYSILMHNKFAIVDSSLLLTGSLNWTKSAVLLNYDNVLVTSNKSLVDQYSAQFNLLWSKFKPYGTT
jgi:phosphatidylserine/phosphatidylglycerophosphate/cardiolipin synthase-like enzyme